MLCTKCPHKRAPAELRAVDTVHGHSTDPRFMAQPVKDSLDAAYGLSATYRKRICTRCKSVVYTVEHEIDG